MRLALKYQILMAPATVLLLMSLLLVFLQATYWDLSAKRRQARKLGAVFVALAETDLAAQHLSRFAHSLNRETPISAEELKAVSRLHRHMEEALGKVQELIPLPEDVRSTLNSALHGLNPENGLDQERILSNISTLRPQLVAISEKVQRQRYALSEEHARDIDALVTRTALVSLIVLGAAIVLGIFLSLFFARNILRRIQFLSDSAGRIAAGDLTPPPAPKEIKDELDNLSFSINRMTDRLIRVVGAEKLLEGAEEERRRIAMDIHDQTLADLSSVLRGIQALKTEEACSPQALHLEEDLQKAIANLREVMDNLHPQTLDILGLGAALESHLERHLAKEDLPEYHLYISPEIETADLPRLVRLSLYRIAVEAVHNVVKHAGASRYEVSLDRKGDYLVLAVEDNGIGFEEKRALQQGGRGLHNIRERARAIGARIDWKASRFNSGTRFELFLPFRASATEEVQWSR